MRIKTRERNAVSTAAIITLLLMATKPALCSIESYEAAGFAKSRYGKLDTGEIISQYRLQNGSIRIDVINYGAIITRIEVPDVNGRWTDVTLGYDNLKDLVERNRYFGTVVGRFAGRIDNGQASIEQTTYQLTRNRPPHHLHGGANGFHNRVWQVSTVKSAHRTASIQLALHSRDGEEGYPGNLNTTVTYSIKHSGTLEISYEAQTDKTTIINPTQHLYFNLSNRKSETIKNHLLQINAQQIIELDQFSIPTGNLLNVANTPFDFIAPQQIGRGLNQDHPMLTWAKGYDHYFVHKDQRGQLTHLATLSEVQSGRQMKVYSTEQGAQIYTANYLNDSVIGKGGIPYQPHMGICIETGQFPNSPAMQAFETYLLRPGETYRSVTVYEFSH